MAFRDRLGRFVNRVEHAKIPPPEQFRRYGEFVARRGGRATLRGVEKGSRRFIGLTPSEYTELRRLRAMKKAGVFKGDERYLLEPQRLRELESRFRGEERKRQAYKYGKKAVPPALKSYLKRLRA